MGSASTRSPHKNPHLARVGVRKQHPGQGSSCGVNNGSLRSSCSPHEILPTHPRFFILLSITLNKSTCLGLLQMVLHPHRHHHPSLESAGGTGRGYSCGVDGRFAPVHPTRSLPSSPSTPPGQPSPFIHPTIIILQTSRARASWRRTRRAPTPRCRLGSAIRPCACIRRPRGSGNDSG